MIVLTGNTTMLYCPKCRRTYEVGTQRFCDNDGGRLLPAPSAQKANSQANGVFSNLLGKISPNDTDNKINPAPRFVPLNRTEESNKKLTSFPSAGRIFQSEQFLHPTIQQLPEVEDSILELEPMPKAEEEEILELEIENKPVETRTEPQRFVEPKIEPQRFVEPKIEEQKPLPRIINPSEIPSGTAQVGDRRTNPTGRTALSWENTDALLGQSVKGRYRIIEKLEEDDEESLIYLAEDKILVGNKVIVRVFMNERLGEDDFEEKIFAEERVSLAHLNHPNIAGFFDSGELPEGNEFIVSEFIEGKSLAEMLGQAGQFNSLRTARIIRQTSYALSEAHQNGILHRNLKPENIFLTVSEAGIEQVKLMNFGVSHGEITDTNLAYKAPEEIEGDISTFASDIYALAVIAYQMLTQRLPFKTDSESALLKAQKAGLMLPPTTLRLDIQPLTDKIIEKALAFNQSERYPKARDFGDAFFNALTTVAPWTKEEAKESVAEKTIVDEIAKQKEFIVVPAINQSDAEVEEYPIIADIHITPKENIEGEKTEIFESKSTEPLAWEKRSPELPQTGSSMRGWLTILGVVVFLLMIWGVSRLFLNSSNPNETSQNQANPTANADTPVTPIPQDNSLTSGEPDIAPEQRVLKQPENYLRFQNSREKLKGDLAKHFLGFDIFYPQDWIKAEAPTADTATNFLDVKRSAKGFPIEQILITHYESRGMMTLDIPTFPKLVEKSNANLKKNLGDNYKVISKGAATIQNGRWKVYEVKFQSWGLNEKGDKIMIWGRRLWLPVQRSGEQNGFVITLLASSLSDKVKSVNDVGTKGELADVLESFEPEQF